MATEVPLDLYRARAFDGAPTINDDETKGFKHGSRWFNTRNKRMLECVDSSVGAAQWIYTTITASRFEYIRVGYTTSNAVYEDTGCSFPFLGDQISELKSFKIVGNLDNADPTVSFDVQIRDETNGATIAEVTGLTGTNKQIFDLGTIANLPTSSAVFTVFVRRSGSATVASCTVYSLQIEYIN